MRKFFQILIIFLFLFALVASAATQDDLKKQIQDRENQIKEIEKEIAEYQKQIDAKVQEAGTLKNQISRLEAEI